MAEVTDLFVAAVGSEPMESVEAVEAVAGRGLRGDRYFADTGHYSAVDGCQVTLIAREAIAAIDREYGIDLTAGQHRRNVVVDGIDVHDLLDHRVRIGDAILEGMRPRPPCAHLERVVGAEGVAGALGDGRGGICADVVESGRIAVGDAVTTVGPADVPDAFVERLQPTTAWTPSDPE